MKRLPRLLASASLAAIYLQAGFAAAQTTAAQPAIPAAGAPAAGAPVPINITATQGIEWRQADQEVIANGDAHAVRGAVTVIADQLIAHYRKKAVPPGQPTPAPAAPTAATAAAATDPESALDSGDTEIYQLDAIGHVHIFTTTDNAYGDHAVYSMDNAVLVLTGAQLKLTTPTDVITARDSIEYYSVKRVAIARGNALIVANDGRSIAADILIGYLAPPPPPAAGTPPPPPGPAQPPDMLGQSGKLEKVDAIGHVVIRTPTETAAGNRGVYLPEQGTARLGGNVHIIRGPNQLNGADALFNTKTGVATLLAGPGGQVSGIVVPSSGTPK